MQESKGIFSELSVYTHFLFAIMIIIIIIIINRPNNIVHEVHSTYKHKRKAKRKAKYIKQLRSLCTNVL